MVEEPPPPPSSSAADHSSSASQSLPQNFPEETQNKHAQSPASFGLTTSDDNLQKLQMMAPGLLLQQHAPELMNHGPGLYAVTATPFMGSVAGFPSHTLIPFTYNLPTTPSSSASGAIGQDQGQGGQPQMPQQPPAQQRQVVVRRFQIAIQIDVPLILKLAAVIFLFNQDGSRQKLALLIFFASIIYLYQTGALAPLVRWLSQGMNRAAAPPPQPPRPPVRADNPAVGRQGNEDAALADGLPGVANDNQQANDENGAAANEPLGEAEGAQGGNRWWGIVKEIQMIVFGFITSLLPGFHHHID